MRSLEAGRGVPVPLWAAALASRSSGILRCKSQFIIVSDSLHCHEKSLKQRLHSLSDRLSTYYVPGTVLGLYLEPEASESGPALQGFQSSERNVTRQTVAQMTL